MVLGARGWCMVRKWKWYPLTLSWIAFAKAVIDPERPHLDGIGVLRSLAFSVLGSGDLR